MTTTRLLSKQQLVNKLKKEYPTIDILVVGEANGIGRIVINAEESPTDRNDLRIFNYYIEDYNETSYIFGVRKHLHDFLSRNGWYAEWQNPYTISLYQS